MYVCIVIACSCVWHRNMPLLVIGGISPAEAAILGEGKQAQGYLEVATLYGGIDRRGPDHSHLWHVFGLTTGEIHSNHHPACA